MDSHITCHPVYAGDVNLVRVGPKKLKVSADVSVDGKLNVKGMSFKAMADRIAALEKKVADNDKHTRAAVRSSLKWSVFIYCTFSPLCRECFFDSTSPLVGPI